MPDSRHHAPARRQRLLRGGARGTVLAAIAAGALAFAGPAAIASHPAPAASADDAPAGERQERSSARFEARSAGDETTVQVELDDEERREVTTTGATVGEALLDAGIVVDDDDLVSFSLGQPILPGMIIGITTVDVENRHVSETDPYETIEEQDGNLLQGERVVATEGVDGVMASTQRVVHHSGEEVYREIVARATLTERVDEVVRVGTAVPEPEPEPEPEIAPMIEYGPAMDYLELPESDEPPPVASAPPAGGDNRSIGAELAADRGWEGEQFQCLDALWERESNWRHTAENPSSGAYGIPQSLPASKMASVAADYRTNPVTQITWGLNYIAGRYGSPCAALAHSDARNWY